MSLCVVEVLVHFDAEELPDDYVVLTIEIPDHVPIQRGMPAEAFASNGREPVWEVPSVIVPQERNVVLYPEAARYEARITKMERFWFDPRLLKKPRASQARAKPRASIDPATAAAK
jgi:hypothetical protein